MIEERLWLAEGYDTLADVEEDVGEYFDATTLRMYAQCPRLYDYKVNKGLGHDDKPRPMTAGSALHEAIDVYTITNDPELALTALRDYWGDGDNSPTITKFSHLVLNHLEVVLKNYIDFSRTTAGMQYAPVTFKMDEIDFTNVKAAKLRIFEGDTILFGESSWLMELPVPDRGVTMYYSGKPDMLVKSTSGNYYIMDHKTTSSYLSDWNFEQHRVSNQLRGYMGMLRELVGRVPHGGLVNGVYVGDRASNDAFKGTRFRRYKYNWDESHVDEAIVNQWEWSQRVKDDVWFPQSAGLACRGCDMGKLCDAEPALRSGVAYTDYEEVGWRNFFDL